MKIGGYIKKLTDRYRNQNNKALYVFFLILRILVVLTAVRCLLTQNYESFALCILTLVLFLVPAFIEERFKISIPPLFQGIIFFFIFAAEILGEVNHYYVAIPGWDTMLHTMNGFLCAAIGFSLVYLLNRGSSNVKLSPFYLTLVAFCFSMTIGVIWEFFEFAMDQFFYLDMQKDFIVTTIGSVTLDPEQAQKVIKVKDIVETTITTASGEVTKIQSGYLDIGIIDSMKDLLVNLVGAVIFSIIGYITLKKSSPRANRIAEGFMVKPDDPDRSDDADKREDPDRSDAPGRREGSDRSDAPAADPDERNRSKRRK